MKKSKGIQYGKYMSHADYQDQMLSYYLCEREKLLLHKKTCKYGKSSVDCKCIQLLLQLLWSKINHWYSAFSVFGH